MTKIKSIAVFIMAILLFPSISLASTQASKSRTAQGYSHLMCDTETTTAVPCAGATDGDVYAIVDRYDTLTFVFSETSGTPATCDAFAVGDRQGAIPADLESLSVDSLFSTPLSITQRIITLTNVDFKYVWVTCTSAAMNVTVELRGAEADH